MGLHKIYMDFYENMQEQVNIEMKELPDKIYPLFGIEDVNILVDDVKISARYLTKVRDEWVIQYGYILKPFNSLELYVKLFIIDWVKGRIPHD